MTFAEGTKPLSVVESLIAELEHGIEVIRGLDDVGYASVKSGSSSIGAHIRHNLDFVNALLNGIATRRIDYNARSRDPRVEKGCEFAAEQLSVACRRLQGISPEMFGRRLIVRSELDEYTWHTSSVSREIEFLHNHTVHHYALIARFMTAAGQTVNESFGVAPSTLRFRSQGGGPYKS